MHVYQRAVCFCEPPVASVHWEGIHSLVARAGSVEMTFFFAAKRTFRQRRAENVFAEAIVRAANSAPLDVREVKWRYFSPELVVVEVEHIEIIVVDVRWNRPSEFVDLQLDNRQVRQLSYPLRDRAREAEFAVRCLVAIKVQLFEVDKLAHRVWKCTIEVVDAEVQVEQSGQVSNFSWDLSDHAILSQID